MTKLLEKAWVAASKLPQKEQDALGSWILEELASEQRWEKAFSESADLLGRLAEEALAEHREGRTKRLDPDKL
jgi:hypothetical protein